MSASPSILDTLVNAAQRFGQSAYSGAGGVSDEEGKNFFEHPLDTLHGMINSQGELGARAGRELKSGDIKGGLTHGAEYLLPLVGPTLAHSGDQLTHGDIAGGAGTLAGLGGSMALAGEHPSVAENALREHSMAGGSTFNPRTGESMTGTRNVAVSVAPEHTAISDRPFTPEQYSNFVSSHRDLMTQHPNLAIGTHFEPETGLHHLEIVGVTPSKQAAGAVGARLGEGSVYNLATDEKIPTGVDTGLERSPVTSGIDQRIADLNSMTPTRRPYSGTHFSDADLELIDGSRRGATAAGGVPTAEAARLQLGSKTGLGADAPPGFYTYHAGALPDPTMAAKRNAYTVRGNMSFATTEDPVFQNGYGEGVQRARAAGADPHTAHQLGLNAAEHAVMNAGYDGFYSPKHPGVRFHFGDAVVKPVGPLIDPDLGPEVARDPRQDMNSRIANYISKTDKARSQIKEGAQHSSGTPEGAQLETNIFAQTRKTHPEWSFSQVAQEAAKQLNEQIGRTAP